MSPSRPTIALVGGTGALGSGLAKRFAAAGYPVIIGSRSQERAQATARTIRPTNGAPAPRALSNGAAAEAAELVIVTVPFVNHDPILSEIQAAVRGKIVVDATVPLVPPKVATVHLPPEGSVSQRAQRLLGPEVDVVAAFQNIAAHKLHGGGPIDCDVLVCGDKPAARQAVIELIEAIGLRGFHAGPIANAVAVEALTCVLIGINRRYKVDGAGIRITAEPSAAEPGNPAPA